MSISKQKLDELEDVRVLNVSRAQGPYGAETARKYANKLLQRAMSHLAVGDIGTAIWLAQRELDFNSKFFGKEHPFTASSTTTLLTLQRYLARRRVMSPAQQDTLNLRLPRKQAC